jgi:hypothetical protein
MPVTESCGHHGPGVAVERQLLPDLIAKDFRSLLGLGLALLRDFDRQFGQQHAARFDILDARDQAAQDAEG